MRNHNNEQHALTPARRRRRKGIAAICAIGATAIGVPAVAVQAHGDTCSSGLLNTLIQIGDCEGGGDNAAPAAVSQQQQQQGGGGSGGGGSSSSSSSSSSGTSGSSGGDPDPVPVPVPVPVPTPAP